MQSAKGIRDMYAPIPQLRSTEGWEQVAIRECGEPLVSIDDLFPNRIISLASYRALGFSAAESNVFLRRTVADKLAKAANRLPGALRIAVFDGWRSTALQQQIFDTYRGRLRMAGVPEDELHAKTRIYVSEPTTSRESPAPHVTGGAVDLTLAAEDGSLLPMGTEFDEFGPRAATRYFEELTNPLSPEEQVCERNRRLLFNLLTEQGFTNYSEEWWHFDYGNQFWARVSGTTAIYEQSSPK